MTRTYDHLEIERQGPVTRVYLNRPEIHNAFDDTSMRSLTECFRALGDDADTRVVVLAGRGKSFCAGADLNWMKRMVGYSEEENLRDSALLQTMLDTIDRCPKPVIAQVHGAVLGGGTGLISTCDSVVATPTALFGATEVKLGLLPAVISPFLIAKIGPSHARDIFMTGERFGADRAMHMGLIHHVAEGDDLDAWVNKKVERLLSSGPQALAAAKRIVHDVSFRSPEAVKDITLAAIAKARVSEEGQEGMAAFLERRPPKFKVDWNAGD